MSQRHPPVPSRPSARRFGRQRSACAAALLTAGLWISPIADVAAAELPTQAEARQVNARTVGIVFHYEDVYRRLIADMADAFETSDVRVVPIIGLNHVQTIYDMLYMKGVDLGIVHSDVFEYMARVQGYGRVYQRINNLVELWTEKVAVIAGEQYRSLADLEGQKVNFREPGKGSDVTGTILFDTVGIEVEKTRFDKLEALEKVKSGEIAAMVYLIEEPVEEFTQLSPADNIRLIGLPQSDALLEHYRATELTRNEFPELIKGDGAVPSLEVPVIIAAYNWTPADASRYEKSRRFASALVAGLDDLKSGDSAELWQNVSLQKEVPGVQRLAMVDELIEEREALEQQRAAEEAAAKTAALRAKQQELMAQLTEQLEGGNAGASELAELERLIEQFQKVLETSE